ncbi:MAG: AzlC family ABC transporter permease [Bacteroidales bacterium]|jgi:predicted branched-subunit amino acid permease|nr:AzlC family ABC transporter permease [Bacteroidales bacterium]
MNSENKKAFIEGFHNGIPIGLGYLAVAFSLGIMARSVNVSPLQSMIASWLCMASAGEFAGFTLIGAQATLWEVAIATFIINLRYLLMSTALSQKLASNTPILQRILIGYGVTDEIFGISIAQKGTLNPYFSYGAMLFAVPMWTIGTGIGCFAGNIMSARLVSALSVALFGMFIAIVIPPTKGNKIMSCIVAISFASSFAMATIPLTAEISEGTRILILTVIISAIAAFAFPINKENQQ